MAAKAEVDFIGIDKGLQKKIDDYTEQLTSLVGSGGSAVSGAVAGASFAVVSRALDAFGSELLDAVNRTEAWSESMGELSGKIDELFDVLAEAFEPLIPVLDLLVDAIDSVSKEFIQLQNSLADWATFLVGGADAEAASSGAREEAEWKQAREDFLTRQNDEAALKAKARFDEAFNGPKQFGPAEETPEQAAKRLYDEAFNRPQFGPKGPPGPWDFKPNGSGAGNLTGASPFDISLDDARRQMLQDLSDLQKGPDLGPQTSGDGFSSGSLSGKALFQKIQASAASTEDELLKESKTTNEILTKINTNVKGGAKFAA